MARRGGSIHVVTIRRHYKDKVYENHLLRRSYRERGGRVGLDSMIWFLGDELLIMQLSVPSAM